MPLLQQFCHAVGFLPQPCQVFQVFRMFIEQSLIFIFNLLHLHIRIAKGDSGHVLKSVCRARWLIRHLAAQNKPMTHDQMVPSENDSGCIRHSPS